MPEIIWRGTNGHNFSPGRGGHRPIAIVNHVMMQSIERTRLAFGLESHQASTTFGIGPGGEIDQYVRVEDMPWANGPVRKPNLAAVPWIKTLCQEQGINPNLLTVSVEWAGAHKGGRWATAQWQGRTHSIWEPGEDGEWWEPTAAQYEAGLWLHRKLVAELGITPDRAHITRHSDFDSVTRAFCPGKSFPMARLLADLLAGREYTVFAPPTISVEVFEAWLRARKSPALEERGASEYYRACVERGINPALALAMFHHESQCGTDVGIVPASAHNWGNLRPHGWGRGAGKVDTRVGPFTRYASWLDGLLDWCDLWSLPLYRGKSIREAIAVYAPSSDGNKPSAYADTVLRLMARWERESAAVR